MKIRLLEPYGFAEAGIILDPDPPVAQLLIDRGVAELLVPEVKAAKSPPQNKLIHGAHNKHAGWTPPANSKHSVEQ